MGATRMRLMVLGRISKGTVTMGRKVNGEGKGLIESRNS